MTGTERTPSASRARKAAPRFFEIVPTGTHIDFVGRFRLCAALSLAVIALGIAAVPLRGVHLGVDFAGGHHIVVGLASAGAADEGAVRGALEAAGIAKPNVVRQGDVGEAEFQIRVPAAEGENPVAMAERVEDAIASRIGSVEILRADFVGPRVGAELRSAALLSLGISFAAIFGYVTLRFAASYAPGAIVALVHDVAVTAGLFVVFGWEFDLNTVAALLTITGYSINDTIVVYDRIRELRAQRSNLHLPEVVNRAINDTLSRTLLTSGSTLLVVGALLVLGGSELRGFATALAIGIVAGTYSTVYVASPIMLWIEARRAGGATPGKPVATATPKAASQRA